MRGGEKCLEFLCGKFPDAPLFTLLHARGSTSPAIERMDIRTSFLQRLPGIERHYRWTLPLMPTAAERLRIPSDVDLVVSFSHAVAKSVRVPRGVPHVCYCFTPMRYAWHMREHYLGPHTDGNESAESAGHLWRRATRAVLSTIKRRLLDRIQKWDCRTSSRVTHFVAISQTIAQRIEEAYGRTSRVIYPPVDTDFYQPSFMPREDFYLCVSALVPYKRIELAIDACNRLGRRLIIIGAGTERPALQKRAGTGTRFLGWRSNEEIRAHLQRCRALLFPGHEDFGIVPVEAQACGAPVIAFDAGGATETIQAASETRPGSGRFFAEQSVDSLAQAMLWLESHPGQLSSSLARQNALNFTSSRYERELWDYLQEVAQQSVEPQAARRKTAA